jgi:hypothetical protein
MALRTAAERAERFGSWRGDPRNKGLTPPVEVDPPGLHAPRRVTVAKKKAVQEVYRQHARDLERLSLDQIHKLAPVLNQAQLELKQSLKEWIRRTPDGELRWTAWKYRDAQAQLLSMTQMLQERMQTRLSGASREAQRTALDHLVTEVARFSAVFDGQPQVLQLNLARILAEGRSSLVPHFKASAERYAWGKKNGVWDDVNRRLAVDILRGAPISETVDRLVQHGGPRGLVTVRGRADDEGAVIELIPEGLFARYRWRAEMYVRTEVAAAYGYQMREGLHEARDLLGDIQKRWSSDGTGCPNICRPMDGQTVPLEENFQTGDGGTVENEPAHPNCRCRTGPWRPHWGALFDSLAGQ